MKNGERYRTARQREAAFNRMCGAHADCSGCPVCGPRNCEFAWLEMEAAGPGRPRIHPAKKRKTS